MKEALPNCPVCGEKLQDGEPKCYETLMEHVSDPNDEDLPLRPTCVCVNGKCVAFKRGFWSEPTDGDWYTKSENFGIDIPRLSTSCYLGIDEKAKYNRRGVFTANPNKLIYWIRKTNLTGTRIIEYTIIKINRALICRVFGHKKLGPWSTGEFTFMQCRRCRDYIDVKKVQNETSE